MDVAAGPSTAPTLRLLNREAATLEISRGLADGDYRTSNVILKTEKEGEKRPDQPIMSMAK